ncbi:hypothetical protein GGU11DRAFT_751168 [Lentinula aff. detonsa]|nr:hypothetical protein GGU11DRAFT_751168 [Lentinula aff. detonsa]
MAVGTGFGQLFRGIGNVAISVTLATPMTSPVPPAELPHHLSPPRIRRGLLESTALSMPCLCTDIVSATR